jgi:hypothetical protein
MARRKGPSRKTRIRRASIVVKADSDAWGPSVKAMQALPSVLKKEISKRGMEVAAPLKSTVAAVGYVRGGHAAGTAPLVKATVRGTVPSVRATGRPYLVGAEFGAKRGNVRLLSKAYPADGPNSGRHYFVQTRINMQFQPYSGRVGYWWWPTVRATSDKVLDQWRRIVDDVVGAV